MGRPEGAPLFLYRLRLLCYTVADNRIPASWPARGICTARAEQDNGVKLPNGTAAVSDLYPPTAKASHWSDPGRREVGAIPRSQVRRPTRQAVSPACASNSGAGIFARKHGRGVLFEGRRGLLFSAPERKDIVKKHAKLSLALLAFVALIGLFAGLYLSSRPDTTPGDKSVTVEVVHKDEVSRTFHFQTDKEYLGDLLLSEGIVKGEQGQFGLYIREVDGERADFDLDKAYWALFVGEDYATQGADVTPLQDGDSFRLVYTLG